jgi:hypothetical protein
VPCERNKDPLKDRDKPARHELSRLYQNKSPHAGGSVKDKLSEQERLSLFYRTLLDCAFFIEPERLGLAGFALPEPG